MSPAPHDALGPEEILRYLDGEAEPALAAHVEACPTCRAEAARAAAEQARLQRALSRFDCPSPRALGEYELGITPPEERTRAAAHLLDCPPCAGELRTLRRFLSASPVLAPGPVQRLGRIIATLVAPGAGPAPALAGGLRASDAAGAAPVYQAGDLTVRLTPGPAPARPGTASLMGLVLAEHAATPVLGRAALLHAASPGAGEVTAEIDELGSFAFDEIGSGTYALELRLADRVVMIEELRIGS